MRRDILWFRTASERHRRVRRAHCIRKLDQKLTDIDNDAVRLRRLDGRDVFLLGAPLGTLATFLVELPEVVQVVNVLTERKSARSARQLRGSSGVPSEELLT